MRRIALLLAFVACAPCWAARYTFTAMPETGQARVSVVVDGPSKAFHMPAWAPGDYELLHYGKQLQNVAFTLKGVPVQAEQGVDPNTWTVPGGADAVTYLVGPSRGNFSVNLRVKSNETFVSGPGVFGWFDGHAVEAQEVRVNLSPPSARLYSTLDRGPSAPGAEVLKAFNYDEMIDAPFVMGTDVRTHMVEVQGKAHTIVAYGTNEDADLPGYAAVGASVAEQAFQLFGELPYPRYIFFLDFGGGGGGLEHLDSTRIGMGSRGSARFAGGIMFHEYFHAFNVKRIRSAPLGPFDYTQPAVTGALWWLEGVTDYYADVLQSRAGMITRGALMGGLGREVTGIDRHPRAMEVSADASSRKVWEVRGSQGFGLSYYQKGKAVGLCLDLAIRGGSNGKASLDDVMRALYQECKGRRPGFAEGRIRELCVKFGGARLGPIYDTAVTVAGPVPLREAAGMAGMVWADGKLSDALGVDAARASIAAAWPAALKAGGAVEKD